MLVICYHVFQTDTLINVAVNVTLVTKMSHGSKSVKNSHYGFQHIIRQYILP